MEQPKAETFSCDVMFVFDEDGSQVAEAPPPIVPVLSAEEKTFADAVKRYQIDHRCGMLNWRDVFEIVQALGYRKVEPPPAPPGSNGDPQEDRSS